MRTRNMTSLYLVRGNRILLLYRQGSRVADGLWTGSAGGHFEEYELNDPEACVLREMNEELGLHREDIEDLNLRYITLRRTKGEIRQNFFFFATLKETASSDLSSNEGILRWFPTDEIGMLEMPYSAKCVQEHYLTLGRLSKEVYVGAADGSKVVFTAMPEYS